MNIEFILLSKFDFYENNIFMQPSDGLSEGCSYRKISVENACL